MQLNEIEEKFFSEVIRAELETPIRANLKVNDDEFSVMVIPRISQDGYFEISYFGTPQYKPSDENGQVTLEGDEIFGVHPVLREAWSKQDAVELELEERPHPFVLLHNTTGPNISARVLIAERDHKGRLGISENEVLLKKSNLRRAEFSLVDIPEIVYGGANWWRNLVAKGQEEIDAFQNELQSAVARVDDDDFSIHTRYQNTTNLHTEDGWTVTLKEDDERTRGCASYSGTVQKKDESEFGVQELHHLLDGMVHFFSFASCAYRHPTAVIGYDSDNNVVWGQIGKFNLMRRSPNWFDSSGTPAANVYLEHFFPKFWSKWKDKKDEIETVIDYYVKSKSMQEKGFPQSAVATIFAGLELLANQILEEPSKNNPTENIKRALRQYDIPRQCLDESRTPVSYQAAKNLGAGQSGIELLTTIRNYVVHPTEFYRLALKHDILLHPYKKYPPYLFVHDLGQFYLEYLFLEMCGYEPQSHRPLIEELNR